MDRNQAKEFYPILQAFAEGKVIECRTKPSALSKSWQDMNEWTEKDGFADISTKRMVIHTSSKIARKKVC